MTKLKQRLTVGVLAVLLVGGMLLHLLLPIGATVFFLAGMLGQNRCTIPFSIASVVLGVTFFILKNYFV